MQIFNMCNVINIYSILYRENSKQQKEFSHFLNTDSDTTKIGFFKWHIQMNYFIDMVNNKFISQTIKKIETSLLSF